MQPFGQVATDRLLDRPGRCLENLATMTYLKSRRTDQLGEARDALLL